MTTPKQSDPTFWVFLGEIFLHGLKNILYFLLVAGCLVAVVWAYVWVCRTFPTVGWIVSGCLFILMVGAVWDD